MSKMILCTILLITSNLPMNATTTDIVDSNFQEASHKNKKNFFIECLPSTITSCVVGAFTGYVTRYIEKEAKIKLSKDHIIPLMIIWWIEHKVRHKGVNSLEKDFKESDIPCQKSLMSFGAWISSWIFYIYFS